MAASILLNGSKGRMGLACQAAAKELDLPITQLIDQGDALAPALAKAEVVIDFSFHGATKALIEACMAAGKPLVIGTTGHSVEERQALLPLAGKIPCVWAGNFSIGVNLLFALTQKAAGILGNDYDAEVIEMHHRFKKDAPSGTAARLLEIILKARELDHSALRHGREGVPGARTKTEVGVHALRGGDVVGDHTVMFAALGERLELTHKASDRGIFARGALRASQWIVGREPGVYDMQDVLGLR